MGNGFVDWFGRSYKGVIIGLLAVLAAVMVVLAMQHVSASRAAAGATPRPVPTFTSPSDGQVRVAFLGDSYTEGVGATTPAQRWTSLVAKKEGWTEINLGQGGTGYLNGGPLTGQADQYETRLTKLERSNPDIIVVSGSQNDLKFTPAQVAPAIRSTIKQIHAAIPSARLIIMGPVNPGEISAATRANDAVVQEAAADVGATYISSISPSSTFESQADYWTDGEHPSDSGHQHIADRFLAGLPDDLPKPSQSAAATSG